VAYFKAQSVISLEALRKVTNNKVSRQTVTVRPITKPSVTVQMVKGIFTSFRVIQRKCKTSKGIYIKGINDKCTNYILIL